MVRKVNCACDWGSGMSAWDRPSLKPGAARKGVGALPRSSEERSGRSRWRWSPGTKEKDRKAKLNPVPIELVGDLQVGLATAPLEWSVEFLFSCEH